MKTNRSKLLTLLVVLLGLYLVAVGILRIRSTLALTTLYFKYHWSYASLVSFFIAPIEIVSGCMLLLNVNVKRVLSFLAFFFFLSLVCSLASYFLMGVKQCGCYRDILSLTPVLSFVKQFVLFSLAYYLHLQYANKTPARVQNYKWAVLYAIGAIACITSGFTYGRPIL